MSRLTILSVFVIGLLFTVSAAQDAKKEIIEDPKKVDYPKKEPGGVGVGKGTKSNLPPAIPGDCEIHFLNGSKVRMIIQSDKLEVNTAYGKLAVPVKEIRAIEFGLHYPDGMEAKIEAAVKGLGSSDYREREKADKALQELAPYSYPAVVEASRNGELEVSKRAKDLIGKLQAKHPKKDLKASTDDKVVTNHFTIVGRILTTTMKAKTEYFGEQEVNIAKMRSMRAFGAVSLDTELLIDSSKYANAGQWLDTNYHCDGRTAIVITAKGLIDVWPQQGGGFMSGPAGFQHTRNGGGPGGFAQGGRKIGNVLNGQQHGGMLLGKIGEDGDYFLVADRFEGIPEREGKLYLHIGPSQWNCQCVGSYDVKIARKED